MREFANKHNIWQKHIYLPDLGDPLTPRLVRKVEATLGQKLPKAYLDLLSVQNGGGIAWTLKGLCHGNIKGIGEPFRGLTVQSWSEYEIDEWRDFGNDVIPFDSDGHALICFDYRGRRRNPRILFLDPERAVPVEKVLFEDFAGYLRGLRRRSGYGFTWIGIRDPLSSYELMKEIAKRCEFKFDEEPDSFGTGYPSYKSGKMVGEEGYWLSAGPNLIPRTFVRVKEYQEDPLRYDRLQKLFPGSCYLFERHPDVRHLICGTDVALPLAKQAIEAMGLSHIMLKQ